MLNALTQVFYTISTVLLVPTELALLVALALACRLTGSVAREALVRRRQSNARRQLEQRLEQDASFDVNAYLSTSRGETTSSANDATLVILEKVASTTDNALIDKIVGEYETAAKERCEGPERLAKVGPALGLMGTLIPLGPALMGLAQGDMNVLASNLVVAFSTTVVGLTVALIASWCASVRKRWTRRDFAFLNFAIERCDASTGDAKGDGR